MKNNSKLIISLSAPFLLMLFANQAYAYLDPGTGSMMVQALLAAVAAVSVSIGLFWRRLLLFFGRLFRREYRGGQDSDEC